MCSSIRLRFRTLPHNQQANALIRSWRHNWEGCSRLSVECTPPTLGTISSSPSRLSAKLCSMCVHRSVQDLEIHSIISRPVPLRWRHNWEGCSRLSVECTPPSLVSISSSPSSLSAKLCSMCVHRSDQDLEIYSIISSPVPISYTRGIVVRAVVGCPSNAHLHAWCLSPPLHHLCLLNFVPCVCIDPFKISKFTTESAAQYPYDTLEAYFGGP